MTPFQVICSQWNRQFTGAVSGLNQDRIRPDISIRKFYQEFIQDLSGCLLPLLRVNALEVSLTLIIQHQPTKRVQGALRRGVRKETGADSVIIGLGFPLGMCIWVANVPVLVYPEVTRLVPVSDLDY